MDNSQTNKGQKKRMSLSRFWILMISILSIALVGVTMITFIGIYRSSLIQEASIHSEQAVSQVSSTIEIYAEQIKQNFSFLQREIEACDSKKDVREVLNLASRMQNNLASIMVYDQEGEILNYYAPGRVKKDDVEKDLSYLPYLFECDDNSISAPHIETLYSGYYPWVSTIGGKLNSDVYGEPVYIAMDIHFFTMLSYVDSVSIGQHGYCFVMDQDGGVVYHPQQQLIFSGIKEEELSKLSTLEDGVYIQKDIIYSIRNVENESWKVIGVSYVHEQVTKKLYRALTQIALSAVLCLVVAFFIIWRFSKHVTRPVKELVKAMGDFEKDAENYQCKEIDGVREISMISSSFAHMVGIVQKLMDEVKTEEVVLRKSELNALQKQINPHFLYNTLDSIQWLCEQKESDKAVKMVGALAKYFRISISKGEEMITVENEIAHAQNYLLIQKYRHSDGFTYTFDVDPAIHELYCNKIILQPLIENAISHGIDLSSDDSTIEICVEVREDALYFIVRDNGMGMDEETCESIMQDVSDNPDEIGLKNVHDRIQIYYGTEYGVRIESELDEGTTVILRLPKIEGLQKTSGLK